MLGGSAGNGSTPSRKESKKLKFHTKPQSHKERT